MVFNVPRGVAQVNCIIYRVENSIGFFLVFLFALEENAFLGLEAWMVWGFFFITTNMSFQEFRGLV